VERSGNFTNLAGALPSLPKNLVVACVMGNALSIKVDELLQGVLKVEHSSANVGLNTSAYHATAAKLQPQHIGNGLWLSGDVASIKVSTQTLGVVGALFGSAPLVRAEVRGVRLMIHPENGSDILLQSVSHSAGPGKGEIEKHLAKFEVELHDVVLEIRLGGCIIRSHIDRLTALPKPTPLPFGTFSWQVQHTELRVDVAGQRAASAGDACVEVTLGPRSFADSASSASAAAPAARISIWRVAINLDTNLRARLDFSQLLAILDLAAAAQALGSINGAISTEGATGPSSGVRWSVKFPDISAQLDMVGEPLLEVKCRKGCASGFAAAASLAKPDQDVIEVQAEQVGVRSGGAAGHWAISPRACARYEVIRKVHAGAKMAILEHRMSFDLGFPTADVAPWQGPLELLLADPNFVPHRAWLQTMRDSFLVRSKKRPREELQDVENEEGQRIRRAKL